MAAVSLRGVVKSFGAVRVIQDVDLEIGDGEFVVLVGPSGCGKSTLLRMVAGLETINSGEVLIGGEVVNDMSPKERNIAMVFQSYALYPHMTVRENLGFSLKLARAPRAEAAAKIQRAADILGLGDLLERKPRELSGGQRQRVAMGRAIVRDPAVFLFDEPLSNLDAALRVQMRVELAELHHRLAATMIYVTHDQVEAMTMAQKIAVLNNGQHRTVRYASGALQSAAEYLRGALHRFAANEHPSGTCGGRARRPCHRGVGGRRRAYGRFGADIHRRPGLASKSASARKR